MPVTKEPNRKLATWLTSDIDLLLDWAVMSLLDTDERKTDEHRSFACLAMNDDFSNLVLRRLLFACLGRMDDRNALEKQSSFFDE
jgi:hypothetical protein